MQFLHHLLDEEVAQGHSLQARLAVGDGIEDGARRLVCGDRSSIVRQQGGDRLGNVGCQGDREKDQRLVFHRRMEEGETPPVRGLQPPAKIVPAGDLVDRFVPDDLLQDVGRRGPVKPPQDQESPVEPRGEEVFEILVDGGQFRVGGQIAQDILPHPEEPLRSAGGEIDAPEELQTPRLGRIVHFPRGPGRLLVLEIP